MSKKSKLISLVLCLVMICALLSSCGPAGKKSEGGINSALLKDDPSEKVNLVWYIRATEPKGFKEVMEAANKYLDKKLNVKLDLRCVESGDYESKLQLASASGEVFDLEWTAAWANNFESNVTKGAFAPLDDMLNLPELKDLKDYYNEGVWDAARVNGKIYGVPVEQVMYDQSGIWFQKSYMQKYGLDPYAIKSMDDIEDIFQTVRDGEPNNFVITVSNVQHFQKQYTSVPGGWFIDPEGKVTDRSDEKDRGLEWAARMRDWNVRGFFPSDFATFDQETAYLNEGRILSRYGRYLPGSEGKTRISYGYDVNHVPTSEKMISRGSVQSTMTAISFTSKHPVRALKFIDLMLHDEYMLNLICYGIEGRDYTKDPSNPKRMIRESGGYYISEFMVGSQFLAYLAPSYEDGVWEQTKKENEEADVDPNIAFSFDSKPVETEISNCSAVTENYTGLGKGLYENYEEVYAEQEQKLDLAGKNIIKAEIERQYKEWKDKQ